MGFSQAPALPYGKLGIPEDGDTASRAISKGKYVIWKGKNYFAKTDILQGETFVEDTNLTEIPDGALNGIADALNASLTQATRLYVGDSLSGYKFVVAYYNGNSDGIMSIQNFPGVIIDVVPTGRFNIYPTTMNGGSASGYGYVIYSNKVIDYINDNVYVYGIN